jgi:hypothetical protein
VSPPRGVPAILLLLTDEMPAITRLPTECGDAVVPPSHVVRFFTKSTANRRLREGGATGRIRIYVHGIAVVERNAVDFGARTMATAVK